MNQTGGGMYWSIVGIDASGVVVGRELARNHGELVREVWKRMKAKPPKLDAEVHELVLRDTTNRERDRHAVPRQAA